MTGRPCFLIAQFFALVFAAQACGSDSEPFLSPTVETEDLRFRTVTDAESVDQFTINVLVETKASTVQEVWFSGCGEEIRVYADSLRTQAVGGHATSCELGFTLTIRPGTPEEITMTQRGVRFGAGLDAGRYYTTAVVRPGGEMIELPAGPIRLSEKQPFESL